MEVLEEANRALVESCNGFLDSMSQPKDEVDIRNAMMRASDALFNANRFSSMVTACRGHARFRRAPKTETSISQNISPDSVFPKTDGNLTKSFLESNSLNDSSAKTVSLAESSPAKDPHFLQPVKFHQDLNVEPCLSPKSSVCLDLSSNGKFKSSQSPFHPNLNAELGLSSKSSACLDLSLNGKSSPGPFDQNLNAEPGFSSKSSVCWDLSSNGKSRHSMFHQNPNAEPGSSSKNSMCLDLSSNGKFHPSMFHRNPNAELGLSSKTPMCLDFSSYGKYRPGIFHQNTYAEPGSSSKSSACLNLSSNGKPPLHRSPFQFHQQLKNQQQHEQLSYQQQLKHRAEMMSRSQINFGNSFHNPAISSSRSLVSSMSIDGSVTNTRPLSLDSLHLKRKCSGFGGDGSVHCGSNAPSGSRCHCAKKRRNKFREIIIAPAISNKISDIPQDEYSWRKYGQKPIKNADHPRGYYKCSVYKGCPAKKRVERCTDDPTKLRITYQNDHNHPVGASNAHSA